MNADLKESLRDTARALPLVVAALVLMAAGYMAAFRIVWGDWPL